MCTEEFMVVAKAKVDELAPNSEKPDSIIENEVFKEMMYSEDNPKQRVVGHGTGVTKNQVFGLKGISKRRYYDDYTYNSSQVMEVKAELLTMKEKNDVLEKKTEELQKTSDELRKTNTKILARLEQMPALIDKLVDK